jgi:signal transduction histidine kinase
MSFTQLRTPLNAIIGFSNLLLNPRRGPPAGREQERRQSL